jgi:hypothetical protein
MRSHEFSVSEKDVRKRATAPHERPTTFTPSLAPAAPTHVLGMGLLILMPNRPSIVPPPWMVPAPSANMSQGREQLRDWSGAGDPNSYFVAGATAADFTDDPLWVEPGKGAEAGEFGAGRGA